MFQARRRSVAAAGQSPDHHVLLRVEIGQDRTGDMTETPGHPVAVYGITYCFGDDQADLRSRLSDDVRTQRVQNKARLCCPGTSSDSGTEFGRPCHPVLCRKHCVRPGRVTQSVNDGP